MSKRTVQPRYLRIDGAAQYCSVSETKFVEWIKQGRMPGGFFPDGRGKGLIRMWDANDIDSAMEAMKNGPAHNEWDEDDAA